MMTSVWTAAIILFGVVEAATAGLVCIGFAAGALAAMIAAMLGGPLWLQILLFIVVSGVLLAALRPIARKLLGTGRKATNLDAVIGSRGIVLEEIDNIQATGRVKLGAMEWSARSTNGEKISAGTQVTVDKIEGVKVFVTPEPISIIHV